MTDTWTGSLLIQRWCNRTHHVAWWSGYYCYGCHRTHPALGEKV